MKIFLKNVLFISVLLGAAAPLTAKACISPPVYLDVFKAKEHIKVSGENVVFMVPDQTTWTTDMNIELMLLPSDDDKTHYIVKRDKHSIDGDDGLITFTNTDQKDVKVFLKLLRATRNKAPSLLATDGGCGAGKVKYD